MQVEHFLMTKEEGRNKKKSSWSNSRRSLQADRNLIDETKILNKGNREEPEFARNSPSVLGKSEILYHLYSTGDDTLILIRTGGRSACLSPSFLCAKKGDTFGKQCKS